MKQMMNLTFVDKYNYPKLVREHFREILSYIDASKVESVILIGSTSRGELSYRTIDSRSVIYSDYEFLIVSKGKIDSADKERLAMVYRNLEGSYSNTPLFHIDFSYIDVNLFRNLPHHLKHHESKKNGITIYGRDLLHLAPDITLENLDFKDLNEILIWRLWAMLLYFPKEVAYTGKVNTQEQDTYKYVLCRNLLDLTTWILPLRGALLSGFKQRHKYLQDNFYKLQDDQVFDNGFLELMQECMIGKLNIKFKRSLVELYSDAVEYFLKAQKYLLHLYHITGDDINTLESSIESNSPKLFHDYDYKRKLSEILFFLKNYKDMGATRGIRWILRGKYGLMLEFLSKIHLAMSLHLGHDKKASNCMKGAFPILQKLNAHKELELEENVEFGKSWQFLRGEFANFMMEYFPSIGTKKDYINSILA